MKKLAFVSFIVICIYSCANKKNIPDVSNINVQLTVKRFDKDLFSIDTNNVSAVINTTAKKLSLLFLMIIYTTFLLYHHSQTVL